MIGIDSTTLLSAGGALACLLAGYWLGRSGKGVDERRALGRSLREQLRTWNHAYHSLHHGQVGAQLDELIRCSDPLSRRRLSNAVQAYDDARQITQDPRDGALSVADPAAAEAALNRLRKLLP